MQSLFLTNTLTGKKELFEPFKKGIATIYSCGPTVYDYAHIGNFRSFLMSDLLVRVLNYAGYKTIKVQNITDVGHLTEDDLADSQGEDKILKKAKLEKKDPYEIARYFEKLFIEDETLLRIKSPEFRPRATEFVSQQIKMVKTLIKKEFAYQINGSVYFRTTKFKDYGKLSKNDLNDLVAGTRVEINSEKENPLDFALWKKAEKKHLMQWNFETGKKIPVDEISKFHEKAKDVSLFGFPGWHIECSAMSLELLGKDFDIHTGGEDNIFPHHECEIAQNECTHGGKIKYWLHAKHLLVDGKKMSKSKGNFYTIQDLLKKGWSGEIIRFALLNAHYRSAMNFSMNGLEMAKNSIDRILEAKRIFVSMTNQKSEITKYKNPQILEFVKKYQTALFDDLNVSDALATTFELINFGFALRDKKELTPEIAQELVFFLAKDFNDIFDILPEEKKIEVKLENEIETKIKERQKARKEKNWELSDKIRDELLKKGIELIDESEKTTWKTL